VVRYARWRLQPTGYLHELRRKMQSDAVGKEIVSMLVVSYQDPIQKNTFEYGYYHLSGCLRVAGGEESQGAYQYPMSVIVNGCWQRWKMVTWDKSGQRLWSKSRPSCPSSQLGSDICVPLLQQILCDCLH